MLRTAAFILLFLFLSHQFAFADVTRVLDQSTLVRFGASGMLPIGSVKLKRTSDEVEIQYCPDNTCEIVQGRPEFSDDRITILAASYFYYFSPYEYLKSWQSDGSSVNIITKNLLLVAKDQCKKYRDKLLAACVIKSSVAAGQVDVTFSRFDEGAASSQKIVVE